jgi:hypothetical protein
VVTNLIQLFLLFEAVAFGVASLIHSGLLIGGYRHREARIAEAVIAAVLAVGLLVTWVRPTASRSAALAAQGFALLGTLVGIFTIAIGVGPRTALDVAYHLGIVVVLVAGIRLAWRLETLAM